MKTGLALATLVLVLVSAAANAQSGALTAKGDKLQPEIIITTLAETDLRTRITSAQEAIEHKSEVARGGPVAAVLLASRCTKDTAGVCHVNADLVIYRPDGSLHQQLKQLDVPTGRAAMPVKLDAQSPAGLYRIVATVRDLTSRRFATVERQFDVK